MSQAGEMLKKALPFIAIGAGVLILILVWRQYARRTGASVSRAYGTATESGIPWYDQYQSNEAPSAEVREQNANPGEYGYTYQGAIPPSPICNRCNGAEGKCQCTVNDMCPNGGSGYGCMDRGAANFDPTATCACAGCCVPKRYGCLREGNAAFNPWANTHDERFCSTVSEPAAMGASVVQAGGASCIKHGEHKLDSCAFQVPTAEATYTHPTLGGLRHCGSSWDLRTHSIGATQY